MKTIHKFGLVRVSDQTVLMPVGAEVLCAQLQFDQLNVWAIVDSASVVKESRQFCIRGTGHEFHGNEGRYIGTFQIHGGNLIFHVFERDRRDDR